MEEDKPGIIEWEGSQSPIAEALAQVVINHSEVGIFLGGKQCVKAEVFDNGETGRLLIVLDDGSAMIIEGRFSINYNEPGTHG